ncbi:MAG: hypothetical protein U5S82_12190 [Gammaproteobacteria bacterium]|nr:hypothetical protein [Gammaproteobacteria bacterium]
MQIKILINERQFDIDVTPEHIAMGRPMFAKMDKDMDRGWRMGPQFIEHPDRVTRAQIVADRLLTALETGDDNMTKAMSAYIADRLPEVRTIHIDTGGEPLNTSLQDERGGEIRT